MLQAEDAPKTVRFRLKIKPISFRLVVTLHDLEEVGMLRRCETPSEKHCLGAQQGQNVLATERMRYTIIIV